MDYDINNNGIHAIIWIRADNQMTTRHRYKKKQLHMSFFELDKKAFSDLSFTTFARLVPIHKFNPGTYDEFNYFLYLNV